MEAAYPSEILVSASIITRYQYHVVYEQPSAVRLRKL